MKHELIPWLILFLPLARLARVAFVSAAGKISTVLKPSSSSSLNQSSMRAGACASWAWSAGWFKWLILVETVVAIALYAGVRASMANARWSSME